MEQELLTYLDDKFTRLEDKVDECAKSTDLKTLTDRVTTNEKIISKHSQIMYVLGLVGLAGIAEWFNWFFSRK